MKKKILFLLIFCISKFIEGQEINKLRKELNDLISDSRYENAIQTAKLIVKKFEDLGITNYEYGIALNNLGDLYLKTGRYLLAQPILIQANDIISKDVGQNHSVLAINLNTLGTFYENIANYKKAEELYLKALDIREKILGENHIEFANSLSNLGLLYVRMGSYSKGESLYLRSCKISKKHIGGQNMSYLKTINNLAVLYLILGQYNKVEPLLIESLEGTKFLKGEKGPEYINVINNLSALYVEKGEFKKAESFYLKAIEIKKKIFGEMHPDYGASINNLAALYQKLSQYKKADSVYKISTEIIKRTLGKTHPEYAIGLMNQAVNYYHMGLYSLCEKLHDEASEILLKKLGEGHPIYANSLNSLSQFYEISGRYSKALEILKKSLEIIKAQFGEIHPDYLGHLGNLAQLYLKIGEYKIAKEISLRVLKAMDSLSLINGSDYARALNNLAVVYEVTGQYSESEKLQQRAIAILKNTFGELHSEYANSLNNLAILYEKAGRYADVEQTYFKVLGIKGKLFGKNHPAYASSLYDLAGYYGNIGKFNMAIELFNEGMQVKKEHFGENHIEFARSLNIMGGIYLRFGDYSRAEGCFLKELAVLDSLFGKNHLDYAYCLNNLSHVYLKLKKYNTAEYFLLKSTKIINAIGGINHPRYAMNLHNLGALYSLIKEYGKAEMHLKKAIECLRVSVKGDSYNYIECLNSLAFVYIFTRQYDKAEKIIGEIYDLRVDYLTKTLYGFSDEDKITYLHNNNSFINLNNTFLFTSKKYSPQVQKNSFEQALLIKSMSLSNTISLLSNLNNSSDITIKQMFQEWLGIKSLLYGKYKKERNEKAIIDSLEYKIDTIEKQLIKQSYDFERFKKNNHLRIADIKRKMYLDEAVVEFVKFSLFSKGESDSIIYAAYILKKNDSVPVFVSLFEEKQLQQLIDSAGNTPEDIALSFYRGFKLDGAISNPKLGKSIYELIWGPLEKHLVGIKKVSFAPTDLLHKIAFHSIIVDSTRVLADKYEIRQFISTRDIVFRSELGTSPKPTEITIFANADFKMDSSQLTVQKRKYKTKQNIPRFWEKNSGGLTAWPDLPGTAEEAQKIKKLFSQNQKVCTLYVQKDASEDNLKALSGNSSSILHIATHGFYFPKELNSTKTITTEPDAFAYSSNSLMRSGLILAGGNYIWSGKTPIEGIEDGVVTAYEIAQLDLSKTELVVLSACQTALGDIKGGEGVFGLQRAFKMAGVKKMIVSLWQVPDKETAELMTLFYSYWMKGKAINEAFAQAQADMRKKYSPFYWAAFVLVE